MYKKTWLALFIAIFLTFQGGTAIQAAKLEFGDTQGHRAEQDIQLVSSLGLMNGTGSSEQGLVIFSPDGRVNRAQLAAVLQRTFQLDYAQIRFIKAPLASDYYQDVDNDAWYANGVLMCAINNIFDAGNDFYPNYSVSRLEVARSIKRSFDARGINVPMIMMMPVFSDTDLLSQDDMNAVVFVNNTGIMKGEEQLFRPEREVTRAELAEVLSRCLNLTALNGTYDGKEYQIEAGKTFVLSLPSNPTTGYSWSISDSGVKSIVAELADVYCSEGDEGQSIVGRGGMQYWQFEALQTGTTELKLVYARPWESVQPAQTFKLKVIVVSTVVPVGSATISNNEVKDKSDTMQTDLNIPVISGLANAGLQSKLNAQFEKDAMDLKNKLAMDNEAYVKECQQNNFPIRPYGLVTRYQETYQNENLLSLYVDYYQYTGGAHGNTERRPYNIDLTSGQELALKDLFRDNYDYKTTIDKEVRQQISADPDKYFTGDMGFKGIGDVQNYYLGDGFLVIYFSQYEIAPYVTGIPEFRIPFSQFQDGIRAELLN